MYFQNVIFSESAGKFICNASLWQLESSLNTLAKAKFKNKYENHVRSKLNKQKEMIKL